MNAPKVNPMWKTDDISDNVVNIFAPFSAPDATFEENLKDWDLTPVESTYDIAANVEVLGLNGFVGRLTAAQQKKIFGANIFGKKRIYINTTGRGFVLNLVSASGYNGETSLEVRTFDRIASIVRNDETIPASVKVEW